MKYTKEILENLALTSFSVCEVLRKLGLCEHGGTHSHISKKLKLLKVETSHFKGKSWNKGIIPKTKLHWKEILVLTNKNRRTEALKLRRALIEFGRDYLCEKCGCNGFWMDSEIRLHVDHIDGNYENNVPENLRFLCPNCHSQTENFCHNKGKTGLISRQSKKANKNTFY